MTLKNSARNCTLKLSEIFLIEWFLNTEKSRFDVPGPVNRLRPAVPRRLKHCGNGAATGGSDVSLGWSVAGYLVQLLFQKVMSGAEGTEKHSHLTKWLGFRGLVSVAQPGVVSRSGNAQVSPLFIPCGSASVPQVAVKGTPSVSL